VSISVGGTLYPGLRRTKADTMVGRGSLIFSWSCPMKSTTTSIRSVMATSTMESGKRRERAPCTPHGFSRRRPAC